MIRQLLFLVGLFLWFSQSVLAQDPDSIKNAVGTVETSSSGRLFGDILGES